MDFHDLWGIGGWNGEDLTKFWKPPDPELFAFNETIRYFTCHGCKVYSAFLDASKAFDKVLHNGL